MTEETRIPQDDSEQAASTSSAAGSQAEASWQEVGRQFQALGDSLAQAVRTAWEHEETQRTVQEMRTGLESMVQKVGSAIDESANSEQGRRIRQDAERAAEALRTAGQQTVQEARPQLINALEQVNAELRKLINRMEQKGSTPPAQPEPGPETSSEDPGTQF